MEVIKVTSENCEYEIHRYRTYDVHLSEGHITLPSKADFVEHVLDKLTIKELDEILTTGNKPLLHKIHFAILASNTILNKNLGLTISEVFNLLADNNSNRILKNDIVDYITDNLKLFINSLHYGDKF